jgi:S-adenosylmethionine-diacylgycerolhomoserine-N-methlytransferase
MSNSGSNNESLAAYYRLHAGIYDMTRWAFLFGRRKLIYRAAYRRRIPQRILEVGCGTGKNLVALAERFPTAEIVGLDLSNDMLDRARSKVARYGSRMKLLHQSYDAPVGQSAKFDLIVFSYSLSMINPGYADVLRTCRADLSATGIVAVVDFHDSRWGWFTRWMRVNHVRMDGQLETELRQQFQPLTCHINQGLAGLWRYLLFIGKASD